ncbi:hypothetical protein JANAI62_37370 [Jannaschia pagri]|uniref:Hedgehog/Intein (Hint) domain-containing protein n=1 Tax=Jannaschia pagri TaxID=2829797 RepID=A0ABQ4NRR7_9RHOB|nr:MULTISPECIES: Hint domain-containing protein [unclassified Jannaschia]GIT93312.1 hypothetical protein JANAI61_37700 [Jannaschia sp. AI_61]GIT97114.1 hypothetical protein JANAI62_37370 [Jannaschia sp. AI_62]
MAKWISIGVRADLDPTEGNFESENSASLLGTIDNTMMSIVSAVSNDGNGDGIIWEDDLGGGETVTVDGVTSGLDSVQTYNATITLGDGSSFTAILGVAQLSSGEAYIIPTNEVHLDNLKIQSVELTSVFVDEYDGMYTTSAARSVDNTSFVCFAAGTLIDTPDGPRAVEVLKPGDQVMTVDNGAQVIRWVRNSAHYLRDTEPDAKPVLVKAGALGQCLPTEDLVISPQHRILVGAAGQLQAIFNSEVFAPAKSLTGLPGIRYMKGKSHVNWVHFAFDRHEVVTANGCLSESLLLGPMVMNGLNATDHHEVMRLFGPATSLAAAVNGPPARECLQAGYVRRLISEYFREKNSLASKRIRKQSRGVEMERNKAEPLDAA